MAFHDRSFCSRLFLFIQQHHLITAGDSLLLAVSGGMDSMTLLHFFERFQKKLGVQLAVAHLDHQLRLESAADCEWLRADCEKRQIPFYSRAVDVAEARAHSARQSSLEAVAREVRYEFFEKLLVDLDCNKLVTAHTASDQSESFLMRWLRGSVQGLSGIRPSRPLDSEKALIRPFLAVSRSDIAAYVAAHRIAYREDTSNQSRDFFRNRLRADVMPQLRQENPALDQHTQALCEVLADESDYLNEQAQRFFSIIGNRAGSRLTLDLMALQALHPALQRRILVIALTAWRGEWKVYTSRHVGAIRGLLEAQGGKYVELPDGLVVRRQGKQIVFERK